MIISRTTTFFKILLLIFATGAIFSPSLLSAKSTTRISREEYINRYKDIAIHHQQRYGIPASITMAQGILESDCGNSTLAKGSNNHFGIKCKDYWTGRTFTHTDDAPDECFRAYDSVEKSYEDHAEFLHSSPRYDSLFNFKPTDYRSWARGLKGAGYATAPDYAERLVKLIEDNKLYLLDEKGGASKRLTMGRVELAKSEGVDPNNYSVSILTKRGYNLYRINKCIYVEAKQEDTYTSIGKVFRLSGATVSKYNDMKGSKDFELTSGERVYIESKRKSWLGDNPQYVVKEGDSLYNLSQRFAIKERSLRRLNDLNADDMIKAGDTIRLHK